MGLHERDYYRDGYSRSAFALPLRSVVFTLIIANAVVWVVQLAFLKSPGPDGLDFVSRYFACHPRDVFGSGFVWQLLTANFLHDPLSFRHILFNMFLLYMFGREIEAILGKGDFLAFYLTAGVLAILAESALSLMRSGPAPMILGASGAVMGVVVLFGAFFPRRQVHLFGVIPMEMWMVCALIVGLDLLGLAGGESRVAHLAHLAGAGYGLLFRYVDLRVSTLFRLGGSAFAPGRREGRERPRVRSSSRSRRRGEVIEFPREHQAADVALPDSDPISERIDEILDKISREGKSSLTEEELEYLTKNSQHYRSR